MAIDNQRIDNFKEFKVGQSVTAEEMNSRFRTLTSELNNLGANGYFVDNIFKDTHIADNAVTQSKILLKTDDVIVGLDDDPATKKYLLDQVETAIVGVKDVSLGMIKSPTQEDTTEVAFIGVNSGAGIESDPFAYHYYQAESDGLLLVISQEKEDIYIGVMVSSDEEDLKTVKMGHDFKDYDGFRDKDGSAPTDDASRPAEIRYEAYTAAGSNDLCDTAAVPIKKDEYFKIHCIENNTTTAIIDRVNWIPFGTGGCVDKGLD